MIKLFALSMVALTLVGCSRPVCACTQKNTYYPPVYTGSPIAVPTVTPTAAPVTTIDDTGSHKTFTLPNGSLINVVLNSTYWSFADGMYNNVLQQIGSETSPCPVWTSVPGSGCGFVSREFRAVNQGSTTINASRTSCGEAMACTGDQGTFSVTIVID